MFSEWVRMKLFIYQEGKVTIWIFCYLYDLGKSNVKVFGIDSKVTTRFKDVAGQDEAK